MTDDDRIPASFVWTGDDGPDDQQRVPEGPALGNYPAGEGPFFWDGEKMVAVPRDAVLTDNAWHDLPFRVYRRSTWGEKLARFLNDLAEKVRRIH